MKTFTTEKGTTLFYKIDYRLGGYNHFTGNLDQRGYILSVRRKPNVFTAFSGLDKESGAISRFLLEVKRRSNKQEEKAVELVENSSMLQEIADRYGI